MTPGPFGTSQNSTLSFPSCKTDLVQKRGSCPARAIHAKRLSRRPTSLWVACKPGKVLRVIHPRPPQTNSVVFWQICPLPPKETRKQSCFILELVKHTQSEPGGSAYLCALYTTRGSSRSWVTSTVQTRALQKGHRCRRRDQRRREEAESRTAWYGGLCSKRDPLAVDIHRKQE